MKKFVLILLVFSISLSHATAQEQLTENQKAVQQSVIKVFEALSNRDSISLRDYCASDILLFEYGEVWNLDTLIRKAIKLNTGKDFKRINTFDFIHTKVNKDIAWATYHLHSEMDRDAKHVSMQWMETVILVKEKKRWKIKVLHSTLIKRT